MNQRTLIIVAVGLVVLSILAFLGVRPEQGTTTTNTLLLPDLRVRLDDVDTVQILTAGNAVTVTLKRTEDEWVVGERDDYAADVTRIRESLSALSDAKVIEQKTANPELYDRLGVEDIDNAAATGLAVHLIGDGIDFPDVVLGNTESGGNRYARLADAQQSVLIDTDPNFAKTPSEWLSPSILDVRGPRIERVLITHADGETVDIFKSEVDQSNYEVADIPEGRELQYPGVANVIANALRDLRLEDVRAYEPNSIEPSVTTEFYTFDGLIVSAQGFDIDDENWLVFSASDDEDSGPASESTADSEDSGDAASNDPVAEAASINAKVSGWRYKIASYQYDQITRRLEDLLSKEVLDEDADAQ